MENRIPMVHGSGGVVTNKRITQFLQKHSKIKH